MIKPARLMRNCTGMAVLAMVICQLSAAAQPKPEFEGIGNDKLMKMAQTESSHKRCPQAIKICDELIRRNPKDSEAYLIKTSCIDFQTGPEAAIAYLESVKNKFKPDAYAYANLGNLYADTQQYEKAIQIFTNGLKLAPQNPEILHRRSMAYGSVKKHQEAIKDLTAYLKLKPDHPRGFQWRADEYREAGLYKNAIEDLNKAVALAPTRSQEIRLQRADLYAKIKDYKKAMADYDTILKNNPLDDTVWFKKGQACMEIKDYNGAVKAFTAVLDLSDLSTAYYARSQAYEKLNDHANALKDKIAGDKQAKRRAVERL